MGLLAHLTICRLTYPLKPSHTGGPGHIPSREVDGWTRVEIEISKPLVRLQFTYLLGVHKVSFVEFPYREQGPNQKSDVSSNVSDERMVMAFVKGLRSEVGGISTWGNRRRNN